MKREMKFTVILLGIAVLVTVAVGIVDICMPRDICDYCHEPFWEEGNQIWEFWTDDRCWSQLDVDSRVIWGNEWCIERMEWIYREIKKRN